MIDAKYTVVLKTLMDNEETKKELAKALSTYPIYAPLNKSLYFEIPDRETINKKLLNKYKYREIGFETPGRFFDELEIAMNEIMPYYNQLFKTVDIMNGVDDIFGNLDVTETFEELRKEISSNNASDNQTTNMNGSSESLTINEGLSKTSSEASDNTTTTEQLNSNSKNVKADTPQSQISIVSNQIDSVDYASEVNWNNSSSNSTGTSKGSSSTKAENETGSSSETSSESSSKTSSESSSESNSENNGTTTHTLNRKGNQGVNTYAHDMKEFRELIMNIEQKIINDERISELFMMVY